MGLSSPLAALILTFFAGIFPPYFRVIPTALHGNGYSVRIQVFYRPRQPLDLIIQVSTWSPFRLELDVHPCLGLG